MTFKTSSVSITYAQSQRSDQPPVQGCFSCSRSGTAACLKSLNALPHRPEEHVDASADQREIEDKSSLFWNVLPVHVAGLAGAGL